MKKIAGLSRIFIVLTILLLLGCSMPTTTSTSSGVVPGNSTSIKIKSFGRIIDNIDTNYSLPPLPDNPHCVYHFYIYYEGNLSVSDIDYVHVNIINDGTFWNIDVKNNPGLVDTTNKVINGSGCYGSDRNYAPLKNLSAEVKLVNGCNSTYQVTFPDPGSLTNNHDYVYAEDCSIPPANSTPLIRRANIISYTKTSSITITFNTNDSLFYNGWVWFFDSTYKYIGVSSLSFRNNTGNANPIISGLNKTGSNNIITLNNSDMTYYNGGTFENISKFVLVLTDGNQYGLEKFGTYDYRSLTGYVTF